MDNDLMNALRFLMYGIDVEHMALTDSMDDDLYNAVSFAQANPLGQFLYTEEFTFVADEFMAQIVGQMNLEGLF